MVLVAREDARGDVARRADLEDRAALGQLGHQSGILDGADAVGDAGDGQREGPPHRLRARVLAGVDAAAEPGICGDFVRGGERTWREARLVAGELEAHDVWMAV